MNMSRMTPGRFYRLLRDVYGRKSLLTCGVLAGGSAYGTHFLCRDECDLPSLNCL